MEFASDCFDRVTSALSLSLSRGTSEGRLAFAICSAIGFPGVPSLFSDFLVGTGVSYLSPTGEWGFTPFHRDTPFTSRGGCRRRSSVFSSSQIGGN